MIENQMNEPSETPNVPTGAGVCISAMFGELVRKHQLAVETLTEQQLAEAIRQAIAAGDFMRNVVTDGRQSVTYSPWREVERLRLLYNELLYSVHSKHEDETRHETALRYIRERENRIEGPCVDSPNKDA